MGFGTTGNQAESSSSSAAAASNQAQKTEMVKNPEKLLKLLDTNLTSACQLMTSFTRTEVRTLLDNAEKNKLKMNYELFSRSQKLGGSYFDALLAFYQKSNRPIKESEFPVMFGMTLNDLVNFLINANEWPLLAEFLLRYRGSLPTIMGNDNDKEYREIIEFLLYQGQPYWQLQKVINIKPESFLTLNRFTFGTFANSDAFKNFDLTTELTNNPQPIIDRINQIIDWEYFNAVVKLLTPLGPELAARVIAEFDKTAWDRINEFKAEADPLAQKIRSILNSLSDEQFADIFTHAKEDILENLTILAGPGAVPAAFEKRNQFFINSIRFTQSVERIYKIAESALENSLAKNSSTSIPQENILYFQGAIKNFMNDPESFVSLLNTHFILAYRYFQIMTPEQVQTLYTNSEITGVRLVETLVEIFALGAYGKRGEKFRTTTGLTKEMKDRLIKMVYWVEKYHGGGEKILFDLAKYDDTNKWSQSAVTFNSLTTGHAVQKFTLTTRSAYYDHEAEQAAQIQLIRESTMRPMATSMLNQFLPLMGESMLQWPAEEQKVADLFYGLMYFAEPPLMQKIFLASAPRYLVQLIHMVLGHDSKYKLDEVKQFMNALAQSAEVVASLLLKFSQEISIVTEFKGDDIEKINQFGIAAFEINQAKMTDFIRWLVYSPEAVQIIALMNTKFLTHLLLPENRVYGAGLYWVSPETFKNLHPYFHAEITKQLCINPLLGVDMRGAMAPPSAPPHYYSDDESVDDLPIVSDIPKQKGVPGKKVEESSDLAKQLAEMQKTLALIQDAMTNKSDDKSREIIVDLCKHIVEKSAKIALLEKKNQGLSKGVLRFSGVKPLEEKPKIGRRHSAGDLNRFQ